MQEKLFFYYTNDLHSSFEHWPRVTGFLKKAMMKKSDENQSHWLFDVGDHIDRVDPIAEAFMGKANVQLMNEAGYDIVTIGNNEGITLAHEDLYDLYDEANFQVVCANLNSMMGTNPDWLQATVKIKSVNGVKIGVIGLTTPFNAFYNLLDWHVDFPYESLDHYLKDLKASTDIIILLSHLGINEDREIAKRYADIDVIIGGHTHHLLRTGETVNNTIITAAGKHCAFVGEVILTWDYQKKKLIKKEAYATNITHLAKDLQTEQLLTEYKEKSDQILEKPVIHTKKPIEVKWFENTKVMQHLTDTLMEWTNADCAMLNAGILLDQFESGDVTYKDIHQICPHPINPCVVELTGDELLEVIRATFTKNVIERKLTGLGFRGEVIGRMIFSGIHIATAIHKLNGEEYVKKVEYMEKPLDPNRVYTVATADAFTFGRLLPGIAKSTTKQYFLPEFIRDLLIQTLQNNFNNE